MSPSRQIDPQRLNGYGYGRDNPLKYTDPDGNDLKLKAGLKKADQDSIIKDAVNLYRKESGRAGLRQLKTSDITYVVGTGHLKTEINLFKGTAAEEFGRTAPEHLSGTTQNGVLTSIDRKGVTVNITLDVDKRDSAEKASDAGLRSPPPSEQTVFNHEIGHAVDKDTDLLKEYNETEQQAEKKANTFVDAAAREKNSMSKEDAEKEVREMLGLPAKEEKKKH